MSYNGAMISVKWFGQACIVIKQQQKDKQDALLVLDPYGKEIGLSLPALTADVVTVSHDHSDHNNISGIAGKPFVINEPGEYEVAGFSIQAISSFHDAEEGKKRGNNLIMRVQTPEYAFAHFGDFGQQELTPQQLEELGDIDIAFVPVGGFFTVDGRQAAKIINQLEPSVAIPIHYKIPGLAIEQLAGPEEFFEAFGQKPAAMQTEWKIRPADVPSEGIAIVQLQAQSKA